MNEMTDVELRPPDRGTAWDRVGRYVLPAVVSAVMMILGAGISWALGLGRSDSIQEQRIEAVSQRVKMLEERSVARPEFDELRTKVNEIRDDTRYLRDRIDAIYGTPDLRRPPKQDKP